MNFWCLLMVHEAHVLATFQPNTLDNSWRTFLGYQISVLHVKELDSDSEKWHHLRDAQLRFCSWLTWSSCAENMANKSKLVSSCWTCWTKHDILIPRYVFQVTRIWYNLWHSEDCTSYGFLIRYVSGLLSAQMVKMRPFRQWPIFSHTFYFKAMDSSL